MRRGPFVVLRRLPDRRRGRLHDEDIGTADVLVNLASREYFKAVPTAELKARVVTPHFKEKKNGEYKIVSFFAKKARGMMVDYLVKNAITEPARAR